MSSSTILLFHYKISFKTAIVRNQFTTTCKRIKKHFFRKHFTPAWLFFAVTFMCQIIVNIASFCVSPLFRALNGIMLNSQDILLQHIMWLTCRTKAVLNNSKCKWICSSHSEVIYANPLEIKADMLVIVNTFLELMVKCSQKNNLGIHHHENPLNLITVSTKFNLLPISYFKLCTHPQPSQLPIKPPPSTTRNFAG